MKTEDIIGISLQIGLTALFLGVFFFTYVSKIEEDVTVNQLNYIVDTFTGEVSDYTPAPFKNELNKYLSAMKAPDLSAADEKVKKHNNALKMTGFQFLAIPAILAFVAAFVYYRNRRVNMDIIIMVGLSLLSVAIVQVLFLNLVVLNYLNVDTNKIRRVILHALLKRADDSLIPRMEIPDLPTINGQPIFSKREQI